MNTISNKSAHFRVILIGIALTILIAGICKIAQALVPLELTTIAINPTDVTLNAGETVVFTAEGQDQYGDPYTFDPLWEGDGTYGTITPDMIDPYKCTYTATQAGSGYIICWESPGIPGQNVHGSTDITIQPGGSQVLTSIVVEPENITLELNDTQLFTATGYDQNSQPMDPPITPVWSATGGTISTTGEYTATETGTFTVTAGVEGSDVTGNTTVEVNQPSQQLARIEVEPNDITIEFGGTQQYTATGYDQQDQPMVPSITLIWLTSGGTISTTGLYTATEEGTFTITAGTEGSAVTGETDVTVNPIPQRRFWRRHGFRRRGRHRSRRHGS